MTVPIEIANIDKKSVITSTSRYLKQNVIYYGDNRFLTFDIYLREKYKRTGNEKIMLVTKGVEYRPDLVSYQMYGVPDMWWRIMEVNGMKDIMEFAAGKTIILPTEIF
jgi:hypothetical protein